MRVRRVFGAIIMLGALSVSGAAPAQQAACGERCLRLIAGAYMDALTANDPAGAPVAANARTTENGVVTPLTAGLWKTASAWTYRHTIVDTTTGQIGVIGSVFEGAAPNATPAMIGMRLKVVGRKVVESEILVSRKGDFSLFVPDWAAEPKPLFKQIVPVERRATRAQLADIPRRYFKAIAEGKPDLLEVDPDAVRVENGYQTTSNPKRPSQTISEGLRRLVYMQGTRLMRTPVIDESRGLVFAILVSDMPNMDKTITVRGKAVEITSQGHRLPRSMFVFELFKVEDGMLTGVEAVLRDAPLGADQGWPAP